MSELTYGQKAVGLKFNPSNDDQVAKCKQGFADEIDRINEIRENSKDNLQIEECTEAINRIKTAQMWAVKAITRSF